MSHPKRNLKHGPIVDWVEKRYLKLYGRKPRDIWRAVRRLHQKGKLIKVKRGVYRYDPEYVHDVKLFEFPEKVKEEIFKRDNYRCVVCGLGRKDSIDIHADHIVPLDKGGTNTIDNGQTLCSRHNIMKKNYSQTEAGKKYFIKIYKQAVKNKDKNMIKFCKEVLDAYDKHKINTHIPRPNKTK